MLYITVEFGNPKQKVTLPEGSSNLLTDGTVLTVGKTVALIRAGGVVGGTVYSVVADDLLDTPEFTEDDSQKINPPKESISPDYEYGQPLKIPETTEQRPVSSYPTTTPDNILDRVEELARNQKQLMEQLLPNMKNQTPAKKKRSRIFGGSLSVLKDGELVEVENLAIGELESLFHRHLSSVRLVPMWGNISMPDLRGLSQAALGKIRDYDSVGFASLLAEFLFTQDVRLKAFMPNFTKVGKRRNYAERCRDKQRLNKSACDAFFYLVKYYTCFVEDGGLDEWVVATRDGFNKHVDVLRAKQAADKLDSVISMLPLELTGHIPPFYAANAF